MKIEIFYYIIRLEEYGKDTQVIGKLHKLRSMLDLGEVIQSDIRKILKLSYVSTIEKVEINFRKLIK